MITYDFYKVKFNKYRTGNLLTFTNALNQKTSYGYDDLNRSAYYEYDFVGNTIYTRDPRSASAIDNTYRTFYGPNDINQLTTLTDPLNQAVSYTYDRSGNLIQISLPNGLKQEFIYDNANRLIKTTLDGGKFFTYSYDGANDLTGVTDQDNKSYSWNYDGAHRLTSSTDTLNYGLNYNWDKSNNLTSLNGSDYGSCQYNYGSDNKLLSVTLPNGSSIFYDYDENGRVFNVRYPGSYNYRKVNYAPNGWVTKIQDPSFPGSYSYNYNYYDDGNIYGYSSWAGWDGFSYDNNGRLVGWRNDPLDGGSETLEYYSYDAAGNLLKKGSKTFTYNSANQITNTGFTYDANGNLTRDGNFIYVYNALNQLVQVKKASDNSLVATYTYNHNGLRKSKTVNGVTTNYNWSASGHLIRESSPNGNIYYYYDTAGNLTSLKKNNTTYIVHINLRGDVESITDTSGNIVAQAHYDPWGNRITYSGNLVQSFRYAGYYYDEETGLYYLKSRYYSPALGRFLTRDDVDYVDYSDPQTLNLYNYARNNPVSFTDPDGTSILSIVINVIVNIVSNLTSNITDTNSSPSSSSDQNSGTNKAVIASVATRYGTNTAIIKSGILTGVVSGVLYLDHVVSEWAHDIASGLYNAGKGKTNQRDTGLSGLSNEEVSRRARDKSLPSSERQRYIKEEKARGIRNKNKIR